MNVFLTGATGFVGGELAVLLSRVPQIDKLYCLVRPEGDLSAESRLERVFTFHGDFYDRERVTPVVGDLINPCLEHDLRGMKELREVDVVIHAAADTSFGPASQDSVRRVNVDGGLQILRWAQSLQNLETFVYVGTASICGTHLTNCNIHEDQSPDLRATHLVKYCHTKLVGEMNARRLIPEEKLLVVRPSIIMGDSRDWTPRSYVLLWALAAVDKIRLIPADPQASLDIIPVDFAANAIAKLLFAKRRWTTYHISAGLGSRTSLEKVVSAIRDASNGRPDFRFVEPELLRHMKRWPKKLDDFSRLHHYTEYLTYWNSEFHGNGGLRLLLTSITPYLEFVALNQTFDNSRLRADTSLDNPPVAHDYLRATRHHLDAIDVTQSALDP